MNADVAIIEEERTKLVIQAKESLDRLREVVRELTRERDEARQERDQAQADLEHMKLMARDLDEETR